METSPEFSLLLRQRNRVPRTEERGTVIGTEAFVTAIWCTHRAEITVSLNSADCGVIRHCDFRMPNTIAAFKLIMQRDTRATYSHQMFSAGCQMLSNLSTIEGGKEHSASLCPGWPSLTNQWPTPNLRQTRILWWGGKMYAFSESCWPKLIYSRTKINVLHLKKQTLFSQSCVSTRKGQNFAKQHDRWTIIMRLSSMKLLRHPVPWRIRNRCLNWALQNLLNT